MITLHPLAAEYLHRLDRAADHLPRARRRELVDDIEAHLAEALGDEPSEVEVRTALDRLGDPEEIVAHSTAPRCALRTSKASRCASPAAAARSPSSYRSWPSLSPSRRRSI